MSGPFSVSLTLRFSATGIATHCNNAEQKEARARARPPGWGFSDKIQWEEVYGCAEENQIEQSATADEHISLDLDHEIVDSLDTSSADKRTAVAIRCFTFTTTSSAAAAGYNIAATAASCFDYQFSDPPPPPPPPPAPVLSSTATSTPPLVDAEPPATVPTFQNVPIIPVQSVPPTPNQVPPPVSSSSIPIPVVLPPVPGSSQTDTNAVPTPPQPPPAQTPPAIFSGVSPSLAPTSSAAPDVNLPPPGLNPGTAAASPVIIASSVVGAVAVVGLFGFLLWFWRKRILKKRRSTLLTPLSVDPSFRDREKSYVIDRDSLGPTPRSTKLKAALGYNFKRFRGQVGVLLRRNRDSSSTGDRSHFMNVSQHSRNNSTLSNHAGPRHVVTTRDRLSDWWDRLTADMKFNWLLRGDRKPQKDTFSSVRNVGERNPANGGQPDFLTLLGMDDREVEREAQRRRLSRGQGSAGSADHFLGGLGLSFDHAAANPFADINALPHDSAKPAPLTVVNPTTNPFSDANAISAPAVAAKPPTTYIADVRRSRGTSIGGITTRSPSGSTYSPRLDSMYRDSMQSVESFATRRNKFRSDPFDLERPELLGNRSNPTSSNYSQPDGVAPQVPGSAHTRAGSFSSKYSSGVSMDGWSDPGPDVGPSGGSTYRYETESPVAGYRAGEQKNVSRVSSGRSGTSVGKAL
ncbi:hypothetical protein CCHL11_02865 [Colletotrichum chlorophyti]|uniref:Uncharacterized protein n=1 Tax=Colletotrichum chlorophyti TaxID=708187 RepID=A0A1Q8S0S9_9PEZI|nr:hypothetical protein CCHL11_02865 [Colletotrichum chlorophyti]